MSIDRIGPPFFAALHESGTGTKRTCRYVRSLSAFGGKADISTAIANNHDFVQLSGHHVDIAAENAAGSRSDVQSNVQMTNSF
jgi:hypothetical protein